MSCRPRVARAPANVVRPLALLTLSALLAGAAHAAVVRIVDRNGDLTGATGVSVNGVLYDVSFEDGSCVSLFDDCDAVSDLPFSTQAEADAASAALFAQVFTGMFDTDPSKTRGCESPDQCSVFTPYDLLTRDLVWSSEVRNFNPSTSFGDSVVSALTMQRDFSTGNVGLATYAVWTRASAVPAPSTLALLVVAGVALGWSQRHRRLLAAGRAQ